MSYIDQVRNNLGQFGAKVFDPTLELATTARSMIRTRTRTRGIDMFGIKFRPYRESYKRVREARGRQTSVVDLELEKDMLNKMHERWASRSATSATAQIYFRDRVSEKKAIFHQTALNLDRRREFFGLMPSEVEFLTRRFGEKSFALLKSSFPASGSLTIDIRL